MRMRRVREMGRMREREIGVGRGKNVRE